MGRIHHREKRLWLYLILTIITIIMLALPFPPELSALEKSVTNSAGMNFVLIPPGTFMMGSPPTEPHRDKDELQHRVTITRPFYMQMTEVTVGQWRSFMGSKLFGRRGNAEDMPVTRVSWYDIQDFVKKLNERHEGFYRLPTEAEWEYACRAGTSTPYYWGKTLTCDQAMFANNSLKAERCLDHTKSLGLSNDQPAPVKTFPPNAWGLYDMHGKVWEWCQDWYGAYPDEAVVNPLGPESGTRKVRRGGSWFKYDYHCRSANRNYAHPGSQYRTTGFRVVREVR